MRFSYKLQMYSKIGGTTINRFPVPDQLRDWSVEWSEYKPNDCVIDFKDKPWADPEVGEPHFQPKWNAMDGQIDRRSHSGVYRVLNGVPLNPLGRTGIARRGKLGRWGPNHASDAIVTRWKRNENNEIVKHVISLLPILQFVSIERRDRDVWAIPGGMVDPGEQPAVTVKREFFEEALNSLQCDADRRHCLETMLDHFFANGTEVYRGCVDDPRNTDNAWMETVAINFHDSDGTATAEVELSAGDDAKNAKWLDIDSSLKLYANHCEFILKTVRRLGAHW